MGLCGNFTLDIAFPCRCWFKGENRRHWWSDRPSGCRSCASQYSSPIFERNWSRIFCPRVGMLTNLRRLNLWHSWRGLRWLKSPVIIIPVEGLSISKLSKHSVMWSINSLSSVHVFPGGKYEAAVIMQLKGLGIRGGVWSNHRTTVWIVQAVWMTLTAIGKENVKKKKKV